MILTLNKQNLQLTSFKFETCNMNKLTKNIAFEFWYKDNSFIISLPRKVAINL